MLQVSDEQLGLAWHDATCPGSAQCRSRATHAAAEAVLAPIVLRRFVDALAALSTPDADLTDEDLKVAEERLHRLLHVTVAAAPPIIQRAMHELSSMVHTRLVRGPVTVEDSPGAAGQRFVAEEIAATVLGRRDQDPIGCKNGAPHG